MLKEKKKKRKGRGWGQTNYLCRQQGRGGLARGAATGNPQSGKLSCVRQAAGHPREPLQPLSNPTLCCTLTDGQNSLLAKGQVNKDHQPFIRLIYCDYKLIFQNYSENEFCIAPFFLNSSFIYPFLCSNPTSQVMLRQALFGSTAHPPDQHPAKVLHYTCQHYFCLRRTSLAVLFLHPLHRKDKQRWLYLVTSFLLFIHT